MSAPSPMPVPPDTRVDEIAESIALIEQMGPNIGWSFSSIVSDQHALPPYGRGVSVIINGPGSARHPASITVFEKSHSFRLATERAIARFIQRQNGASGA